MTSGWSELLDVGYALCLRDFMGDLVDTFCVPAVHHDFHEYRSLGLDLRRGGQGLPRRLSGVSLYSTLFVLGGPDGEVD